jgi:hypothetical protein
MAEHLAGEQQAYSTIAVPGYHLGKVHASADYYEALHDKVERALM